MLKTKLHPSIMFAFACIVFFVTSLNAVAEVTVYKKVESRSYKDINRLFEEIGYTAEQWRAGIREIPRIRITDIPQRWQEISTTIPVKDKKNIFFRLIGSGILIANEKISKTRKKLLAEAANKDALQSEWLHALAVEYAVIKNKDASLSQDDLDELILRVDTIPPSLALAQGAIESGWGTSRFAVKGNSLFGQWDFSGKGIKPEKQRSELGNYGIAAYDNPQASIDAYMLNLNTHNAYRKLRAKRAELRKQNKPHTGWELAKTLDRYSERGTAYIEELHSIMRYNKLNATDDAYLWDKGEIIISPVP